MMNLTLSLTGARKRVMIALVLIPVLWLSMGQHSRAASVLIHDYQFSGNFSDSLGGPALAPLNGTGTLSATNYSFAANQGLSLSGGLPAAGNYSIVADFSFAATNGYRKIVDFNTQTLDSGLYNLNTALNFYPVATGPTGAFANNVTASVALTRDGTTNQVVGYVNGVQQITFPDGTTPLAVFTGANNEIRFFIDDVATLFSEASAGVVDRIRIYDGALTAAQVSAAPATHWLGATDGNWTGNNWASDAAGTPTAATPTPTEDITFSANGAAHQTTTLGADFAIKSLTVNDLAAVTIGGANTLTISATNAITVNLGAGLLTINAAGLVLSGATPAITVNNAAGALISTGLDTRTASLTKLGTGTLTLTGTNTYTGATTVNGGTLQVSGSGKITATSSITIDGTAPNNATMTVDGTGASGIGVNTNGGIRVGVTGPGTFNVTNGGKVTSAFGVIGQSSGSVGTATVTGAGSTWTLTGSLFVDTGGTGTLNITNGGAVSNVNGFIASSLDNLGTVTVDGAGSKWTNSGNVTVGDFGPGVLNVTNGGVVTSVNGVIGNRTGSVGITTVNGSGSKWTMTGDLTIGVSGTGTLNIQNAGVVTNVNGNIDFVLPAAGIGTVTVDGGGSTWNNSGALKAGISGAGTLNIQNGGVVNVAGGVGTVTLAQNGGSTGTLNIGNGGGAGTLNAAIVTGGGGTAVINFNHTDAAYTFAPRITGSIAVNQNGGGTTILSGANTYTGGTSLNAGVLGIFNEGNLGDPGGALNFNGGTLRFLAPIGNFMHAITLNAGGGTFDTPAGGDSTINGVISGPGGLTKLGLGSLTLTAANTSTGASNVDAGTLFVDGSLASANVNVNPGGTLGGNGMFSGNVNNLGGIISPGHSPGTITINGNFTQSAAGTLKIEIGGLSSGQFDLVKAGGSASLAGTLQLVQLNGFQFAVGDKVTFLTAGGGVSGTFGTVVNPFSTGTMIGTQVIYGATSVSVQGVQNSFAALVSAVAAAQAGQRGLPAGILGETQNQMAVAVALDESLFDSRNAKLIGHLDHESLGKVLEDLDRIAPEELTSIFQIAVALSKVQTFNLQRRLDDVRSGSNGFSAAGFAMTGSAQGYSGPLGVAGQAEGMHGPEGKSDTKLVLAPTADNRWGVFVTGTGEWASVGDTNNAAGYDLTSAGFTLGLDYKVTSHFVVGLAAGYSRGSADLTGGGRVTADGGKLALYTSYFAGGFYADAAVQGGYNSYLTRRAALDGAARGYTDGGELSVLFGAGYQWKAGGLTFGPTGNFEYTRVGLDSFTERGSLAPLDYPNQHQESLRSTFGAKATYDWKLGRVLVRPELRAGWQHEYGDATFAMKSSFASGAGPEFLVHGPATGRDSLVVGAGVAVQCSERISTYVYYDGELARTNYQAHSVSGGFRFEF